jgi:diadenosine tetraphosphatase ApaH/serine/threonine PP2A family protein phosphatase
MLRAVLSDIHGNLEALETVLADLERAGASEILCLGDFVGYGASPNECIDRLRPIVTAAVVGNHDVAVCGRIRIGSFSSHAAQVARWTETVLTPQSLAYLESLPFTVRHAGALLVHASPSEPRAWHYVLSVAEARAEFGGYMESLCLIGHSHYPGAYRLDTRTDQVVYSREPEIPFEPGSRLLVNVPSVGQPRDGDPRAGYLLWDDGRGWARQVRVEYDFMAARQRILDAGLPTFLGDRLQWGE